MLRSIARNFFRVAALALALLLVAGCATTPELISAKEATTKYQDLVNALSSKLSQQYATRPWQSVDGEKTALTRGDDGHCRLNIGKLRTQDSLPSLAGGWKAAMEAINPLLKEHGFAEISSEDSIKGGWTGVSSSDQHGGKLRIVAKGYTELSLASPVSDDSC